MRFENSEPVRIGIHDERKQSEFGYGIAEAGQKKETICYIIIFEAVV